MLTRSEAEEITRKIKTNFEETGRLIKQARDGKAWKALGYSSFSDWLQNAVGISRSRGYQLINIASMEDDLRAVANLPEDFTLSSRTVQQIINYGSTDFLLEWGNVSGQNPVQNEQALHELVQVVREKLKERDGVSGSSNLSQLLVREPNRYVLIAANALLTQVEEFPLPEEVDDAHLAIVRGKLRDSLTRINEQIGDYSGEVRLQEASNA